MINETKENAAELLDMPSEDSLSPRQDPIDTDAIMQNQGNEKLIHNEQTDEVKLITDDSNDDNTNDTPTENDQSTNTNNEHSNKRPSQSGMPENLKPLVEEPPESLEYQFLSGKIISGLPYNKIIEVSLNLNKYVDICISKDLIGEAFYIQGVISDLKADHTFEEKEAMTSLEEIDNKITETQKLLDDENQKIEEAIENENKSREEKLQQLEDKYQDALQALDDEWSSEEKSQQYTKPSAELLNLRFMLTKMIKSKQLENIKAISHEIEQREAAEVEAAKIKMNANYQAAELKITEVYNSEKRTIIGTAEKKINMHLRAKELRTRKYISRIEVLKAQRAEFVSHHRNIEIKAEKAKKRSIEQAPKPTSRPYSQTVLPNFVYTAKLPPPIFVPKKRMRPLSQVSSPVITKPKTRNNSRSNSRLYDTF